MTTPANINTVITKLNGQTGLAVWSRRTDPPFYCDQYSQPLTPTMLANDGDTLFSISSTSDSNAYLPYSFSLTAIGSASGNLLWSEHISDFNSSHRTIWPSVPVTMGQYARAGIAVNNDHVFASMPRVENPNTFAEVGGNIYGFSKDGAFISNTSPAFEITTHVPSWISYDIQSYVTVSPTHIATIVSTSSATAGIPAVAALITDNLYTLPPDVNTLTPSVDIINMAKVGALIVGDILAIPTTTYGAAGDTKGMLRFGQTEAYYCTADYDGVTQIWKVIRYEQWLGRYKKVGVGCDQNGILIGSPTDVPGDIRMAGTTMFICTLNYNGVDAIWEPAVSYRVGEGVISTPHMTISVVADAEWPSGYAVFDYFDTLSTGAVAYDISGGCTGKPLADTNILQFRATRPITIELNDLNGWYAGIAPAAPATCTISVNGSPVGTITFAAGSNTATSCTPFTHAMQPGNTLRVISPTTQDATFADVTFTIRGQA